jgi:hypothetical protein
MLDGLGSRGFALGLHGLAHDLALAARSPAQIDRVLAEGMRRVPGARAFRAPGLRATRRLLECVRRAGLGIDSSLPAGVAGRLVACRPVTVLPGLVEMPVTVRDDQLLRDRRSTAQEAISTVHAMADRLCEIDGWLVLDSHPEVLALRPGLYERLLDGLLSRSDLAAVPASSTPEAEMSLST